MKKVVSFLLVMILLGFFIGVLTNVMASPEKKAKEINKLPEISLKDLNNNKIKLDEINQLTILIFWLPEADSCLIQLERLNQFQAENNEINISAIALGAVEEERLKKIKSEFKLTFQILKDTNTELAQSLNISTIPTTIIYHPQLNNHHKIIGNYTKKELNKKITKLLEKIQDSKSS